MEHKHIYDNQGKQLCCSLEERIYTNAGAKELLINEHDDSEHDHDEEGHNDSFKKDNNIKLFLPSIISFILLILAIAFDNWLPQCWFKGNIRLAWYIFSYAPVGFPVIKEAIEAIRKGEIFSEFLLMGVSTIGAFAIGEYPEMVAKVQPYFRFERLPDFDREKL